VSIFVAVLLWCGGCPAEDLVVGGTSLGIGVIRLLGPVYAEGRPGARVSVPPSLGSAGGINAVAGGAFALAVSARPLIESESAQGLVAEAWARTPFVLAAASGIAARVNLSTEDVVAAYGGGDVRWPGGGGRIRPVLRPIREIASLILIAGFPRLEPLIERGLQARGALVALSDREALETAERLPGALVATTLIALRSETRPLAAVSLNGVEPSVENMELGLYPISATLWLVRKADAPASVSSFLEFLRSLPAETILRAHGGVPLLR
jgi:phosphate transport system substrate-binding protein